MKRKKIVPKLNKKDKINLLIKNIKTKKESKKLNYVKVRLFFIKFQKKTISYKFDLPKNTKVYFRFYLLLLKLIDFKTNI